MNRYTEHSTFAHLATVLMEAIIGGSIMFALYCWAVIAML